MNGYIKLSSYDRTVDRFTGKYFNLMAIRTFDPRTNLVLLDGCQKPMVVDKESMQKLVAYAESEPSIHQKLDEIRTILSTLTTGVEKISGKKLSLF